MVRKLFLFLSIVPIIFIQTNFAQADDKVSLYDSILKKDKIIFGISFDSKPFGFKDSKGEIKGMEVDLAREIAKRILGSKDKVAFKNITSQDRIKAAESGDVDMVISTMTITPQRKKFVDFSAPYFVSGQVICVRKNSKIDSINDLLNKKIIVEIGTTGEKNIKQFAPNALIQAYENNSKAIDAFKNGVGDAITTDDSLLQGLVMDNGNYFILPKKLTKEPYGIAFKKSKRTKSLQNNVNKIIKELKLDGTLLSIKNKWGID